MLIVENGYGSAVPAKDIRHLPKELITRVLLLAQLVQRIITVFADDQHCVHSQLGAAAPQCFGDRRVDSEAKFLSPLSAEIVPRSLIDISGSHLERRPVPFASDGVAVEKSFRHMPGVGAF